MIFRRALAIVAAASPAVIFTFAMALLPQSSCYSDRVGHVTGTWKRELPGGVVEVVKIEKRSHDEFLATRKLSDGSRLHQPLKIGAGGSRYRVIGVTCGEYFEVLEDGRLEIGDNEGPIAVMSPVGQ